ncbi:MAG: hypothetical protein QOE96_1760 [Blastocatellia bacterium]|jgi:hypothetical protein|nr:hypothetical protein [Blastocatellia bacterium]
MADPRWSHLHVSEQQRLEGGNFNRDELEAIKNGKNPWPKPPGRPVPEVERMNIDYHALLPLNGKKFSAGSITATVINIPGPQQNSSNILYLTRFEGSNRRMINLWVAEETLRLNPNAHREVFKAIDEWLKTDEGYNNAPDRYFDETQKSLIPYDRENGPVRDSEPALDGNRLELVLQGLDPISIKAIRSAWTIQNEDTRISSLIGLAQNLPTSKAYIIYLELMEIILRAPSVQYRRDNLARITQHLTEPLLSILVDKLKKESNENDRVRLFDFVFPFLSVDQLQSLVFHADTMSHDNARNLLLARIAESFAGKGSVDEALSVAETLTDTSVREDILSKVFQYHIRRVSSSGQPTISSPNPPKDREEDPKSTEPSEESLTSQTMKIASRVLADVPDEGLDLLDFAAYADALADLISDDKTQKPLTIGIDAAWGTGKTQLMKMVRKRLSQPVSDELSGKIKGRSHFPTVWFNAWKYDKEGALWAALVLEILNQGTTSSSWWRSVRMRLRLKLRRVNWWYFGGAILFSVLSFCIPLVFLLAKTNSIIGLILLAVGVFSAVGGALPMVKIVVQQLKTLQQDLSKYIRSPDYKEKIGFLAQFEDDFGRVIDIVTEYGKWPLVVFIDDLDRCGPAKAVEIVEAINILLESRHCVFVIGMDAKAVAQSIQSKYKSLEQYVSDPTGLTLGELFLEKIVQINFRIPRAQGHQLKRLIDEHMSQAQDAIASVSRTDAEERKKLTQQLIQAEQRGGEALPKATEIASKKIPTPLISPKEIQEVRKELSERAFEDDERVMGAVHEAAPFLDSNPRKIKKFINNFRLHALIAQKRMLLGSGGINVSSLAKAVVISMRWPDIGLCISKDGSVCQTLKKAFEAQELLRNTQSFENRDPEGFHAAQNAFWKVSKNKTLERFIQAEDLNKLLTGMGDAEADNFVHYFHLLANDGNFSSGNTQ